MASLAEIRARLQEQEQKQGGAARGGMDNAIYPFWNIPENSTPLKNVKSFFNSIQP